MARPSCLRWPGHPCGNRANHAASTAHGPPRGSSGGIGGHSRPRGWTARDPWIVVEYQPALQRCLRGVNPGVDPLSWTPEHLASSGAAKEVHMPRSHRPYPPEFRADAVRLVRSGTPLIRVARDLNIAGETSTRLDEAAGSGCREAPRRADHRRARGAAEAAPRETACCKRGWNVNRKRVERL